VVRIGHKLHQPGFVSVLQSILFLLVVMVGGIDTVFGPLIGAVIIVLLPEALSTLGQYRLLFVGVLMLAVLRIAPTGFVGLFIRFQTSYNPPLLRRDVRRFLTSGNVGRSLSVAISP